MDLNPYYCIDVIRNDGVSDRFYMPGYDAEDAVSRTVSRYGNEIRNVKKVRRI